MKILIITNNPDRASFRQRIEIHLDCLRAEGINCTVCRYPTGPVGRLKLLQLSRDFDAVFLHKKRLNPLDALLLHRYARKVVYDFDDAVMYDDKHPEIPSKKRQMDFQRTAKLADLVIAGNAYLAEHARKFNKNVEVLPTGLDFAAYNVQPTPNNDDKIRLVWIGSEATLPYLKEIKPVLEEIGSHFDNVTLRIICDEFFDLQNMEVEKCPWTHQAEVVNLVSSDIGLAPLPDNPFTRGKCGFKILQYAAAGLPTVASPVGINAELISDGSTGFLAVSSHDWVDCVCRLIRNQTLRQQMGDAARQSVRRFDSKLIAARLAELIRSVTS